ncbi:DNA repair exonuclease [Gluconacetobacter entanii]|nr:DNA repair exonuclease [Gluconacetobacter entanii]MBE7618379.1 DNA repair exonuclease [Komagataeibacter sp. FXV2]MBY4639085.1 DNA repair exonuclease [Gluconacetobacter entanii]MCW4587348.1 DNA repair exonuclease [Gluconacetobacter entanii]
MRFVHTSDWQVGKVFRFADDSTQSVLQDQRLEVIGRIGRLAREQGASAVVVAGDIYDHEIPVDRTLRQPIERMRQFPDLCWHLIAGNHDPNVPGGIWDRLHAIGLPDNITAHLDGRPAPMDPAGAAWVIPGGLKRRHVATDPTADMDSAETPPGVIRVGLAHGSVRDFGSEEVQNRIAIDRARRAGLSYLALGDWHGQQRIDERTWYSGTPEIDGFDRGGDGGGHALVVDLAGPNALPEVTSHRVGRFVWHRDSATLTQAHDIAALEHRLRNIDPQEADRVLVWLDVRGALSLEGLQAYQDMLDALGSALRLLRVDGEPTLLPHADDLDLFGTGAVRAAAAILSERAGDGPEAQRDIATAALRRLALMVNAADGRKGTTS